MGQVLCKWYILDVGGKRAPNYASGYEFCKRLQKPACRPGCPVKVVGRGASPAAKAELLLTDRTHRFCDTGHNVLGHKFRGVCDIVTNMTTKSKKAL